MISRGPRDAGDGQKFLAVNSQEDSAILKSDDSEAGLGLFRPADSSEWDVESRWQFVEAQIPLVEIKEVIREVQVPVQVHAGKRK